MTPISCPRPLLLVVLAAAGIAGCEQRREPAAEGAPAAPAAPAAALPAERQLVYVPVYSHVFFPDARRTINLTATLSVRNADPEHPVVVTSVRYHSSDGRLVRSYLHEPLQLAPLASTAYVVEEKDTSGGVGASFLVEWGADGAVAAPVVEAVMISAASAQGISFVTTGRPVGPRFSAPRP